MRSLFALLLSLAIGSAAGATPLALSYSVTGTGVFESFDSIGLGTNAPGLPNGAGWDSFWSMQLAGATPVEQYTSLALPNANPAIDAYNAGPAGGTDRAIGLYTTATGNPARDMVASFRNDTGAPLAQMYVQFDVEFWLQRSVSRWGGIQAFYSPDGTTWTDLGNSFEATLVNTTNTAGFVDGNAAANSVRGVGGLIDFSTYGLAPLGVGSSFFLRFSGSSGLTVPPARSVNQNRSVGGAIDNLWVGPSSRPAQVPEASTSLLLALGLGGLAWRGKTRTSKASHGA